MTKGTTRHSPMVDGRGGWEDRKVYKENGHNRNHLARNLEKYPRRLGIFSRRTGILLGSAGVILSQSFWNITNLTTVTREAHDVAIISEQNPIPEEGQESNLMGEDLVGDVNSTLDVNLDAAPASVADDSEAAPLADVESNETNGVGGGQQNIAFTNDTIDMHMGTDVDTISAVAESDFTVVIMSVNRLEHLRRLVDSLSQAEYGGDTVDLIIQMNHPQASDEIDDATIDWINSDLRWTHGDFSFKFANTSHGLGQVWSNAWNANDHSRAIIFWDGVRVTPAWYKWLKSAYEAYANRTDIAGFSLERQSFNSSLSTPLYEPFLYPHCGYNAYAPIPTVWREFLNFTSYVQKNNVHVGMPNGTSDHEFNPTWSDLFVYFSNQYNLHTLHYNLPPEKTLMSTFDGDDVPSSHGLIDDSVPISTPVELQIFDLDGEKEQSFRGRTLVMSGAAGYKFNQYRMFVESLRRVYDGEIHLLLRWEEASEEIRQFLMEQRVNVSSTGIQGDTTPGKRGWTHFNRERFHWYNSVCTAEYWLCMAVDFRDTMFQLDPFSGLHRFPGTEFFVYEHHLEMNSWHLGELKKCGRHGQYAQLLKTKMIVNAGGLIGTPTAYQELSSIIARLDGCNDQVVLNVAIYADMFNVSVKTHPHGFGNIINVGWDAPVVFDANRRFRTHEFLLAPVVHQYDMVK